MLTLTPAYRDYTSAKAVREAWEGGKDFIISSAFHPYSGRPLSIRDKKALIAEGYAGVAIRYQHLRRQILIRFSQE